MTIGHVFGSSATTVFYHNSLTKALRENIVNCKADEIIKSLLQPTDETLYSKGPPGQYGGSDLQYVYTWDTGDPGFTGPLS